MYLSKFTAKLLVVVCLLTFSTGAYADDYDWTGFYLGAKAGYIDSIADGEMNGTDGSWFVPASVTAIDHDGSKDFNGNDYNIGILGGYNHQFGNVITGIELGYSTFNINESLSTTTTFPTVAPDEYTLNTNFKTDWLMTIRPSIGYAFDKFLIDANVGLAITELHVTQDWTNTNAPAVSESAKKSQTEFGWLVGLGLSYAVDDHWIVKCDYMYTEFDRVHAVGTLTDNTDTLNQSYDLKATQ